MRFINTITWTLINVQDIYKVNYKENGSHYYAYFYLRNGEKHDAYECPKMFKLQGVWYEFCSFCCQNLIKEIMTQVMSATEYSIYDIPNEEEVIWENFLLSILGKTEELTKVIEK